MPGLAATAKSNQQGFTLIEALVALVVVVVGLVGLVLLQVRGQAFSHNAHQDTLAGLYSQDMQERLRANLCYLSPSSDSLNDRIDEVVDTPNGLLVNLLELWSNDHLTGSRSNWSASLQLADNWDAETIQEEGYWRFNLAITLAPGRIIQQSLLVEYREGGCHDS